LNALGPAPLRSCEKIGKAAENVKMRSLIINNLQPSGFEVFDFFTASQAERSPANAYERQ
jgi:hypothetical protein